MKHVWEASRDAFDGSLHRSDPVADDGLATRGPTDADDLASSRLRSHAARSWEESDEDERDDIGSAVVAPLTRVLVVTDAWHPQVNGVVRSLEGLAVAVRDFGARVRFITPGEFRTVPLPGYPEIRLALTTASGIGRRIMAAPFDHIHLATEGPLGFAARRFCMKRNIRFTTSYHTNFPDYVAARTLIPKRWTYAALRRFHNAGLGVFVSTGSLQARLEERGFDNVMRWSRGVDHDRFHVRREARRVDSAPVFLYVGCLAVEKNVTAFLGLDLPGTKVVVGDGPARARLEAAHPDARFLGMRFGDDLARIYADADVFVFPSLSDTFGMVLLEAMASGLPIAAYPVPGPLDVVDDSGAGVMDVDLGRACRRALEIPRWKPAMRSEGFSWRESARQFLDNLKKAEAPARPVCFDTRVDAAIPGRASPARMRREIW